MAVFEYKAFGTGARKIRAALAYPVIMSLIGFGPLIFLLIYIVPKIIDIFADLNHALPAHL